MLLMIRPRFLAAPGDANALTRPGNRKKKLWMPAARRAENAVVASLKSTGRPPLPSAPQWP